MRMDEGRDGQEEGSTGMNSLGRTAEGRDGRTGKKGGGQRRRDEARVGWKEGDRGGEDESGVSRSKQKSAGGRMRQG